MKTVLKHVRAIRDAFRTHLPYLRRHNTNLSLRGYAQLRENKRYVINVTTRMMLANFDTTDDSPILKNWRDNNPMKDIITRTTINLLSVQPSATLAELAYRCARFASRETVRTCLHRGVELGLLDHTDDKFQISDTFVDELFYRSTIRFRHADVVEYSHYCSAFDRMESVQINHPLPRDDNHPLNGGLTLSEALERGLYDEDLDERR